MDISILIGFITAVSGIASAILYVKKMKKEEPNILFRVIKSSYELLGGKKDKKSLILHLETLFENKGNAPGAITDLMCSVRYSQNVLEKYPFVSDLVKHKLVASERPKNFNKLIPVEVAPYGAKKVNLVVRFDNVHPLFLDRCGVTLDLLNPKKWEWKDLPLHIQLTAKYTKGTITESLCVFRKDLPESEELSGSIGVLEHFEVERKFMPKIKEE